MPRYLLLAYDENPEMFMNMSPEEMQEVIQRYTDWASKLQEAGRLELGEKLADGEGRTVRPGADGLQVTDGPFAEAKEVLGGFWLVKADSYEHAVELVKDCPHVEHGTLAIRAIEEMG